MQHQQSPTAACGHSLDMTHLSTSDTIYSTAKKLPRPGMFNELLVLYAVQKLRTQKEGDGDGGMHVYTFQWTWCTKPSCRPACTCSENYDDVFFFFFSSFFRIQRKLRKKYDLGFTGWLGTRPGVISSANVKLEDDALKLVVKHDEEFDFEVACLPPKMLDYFIPI